jgi:nitrogen regulatory protein PII 2
MKEVMAFIRLNKVNQTKSALAENGFPAFTCRKVLGRGKKSVEFSLVENILQEGELPLSPLGEHLTESTRLIPKRVITLIVEDDQVEKAVETIIRANQTGNKGDGKIFVLPVQENYQIRTGEVAVDAY